MCEGEASDRFRALARGRVQGVGFRWHVRQTARRLGLCGTVRNLSDGGVEIWAEGPQEKLAVLLVAVFRGPPAGRVDRLDVEWGPGGNGWREFHIVG